MPANCDVCGRQEGRTAIQCGRGLQTNGPFMFRDAMECFSRGYLREKARAAVLQKQLDVLGEGRSVTWSRDWPTTPGPYWAASRFALGNREIHLVRVGDDPDGRPWATGDGLLVIRPENKPVLWTPASVPPVPDELEAAREP